MSDKWYLIMTGQCGYPQPESGFGYLRATYAMHRGCPTCRVGLVQDNAFRFRAEPKAKQGQFIGLHWVPDQVFVRGPVRLAFEKEKITGIRFSRPVLHSTGRRLKTVFQMHVEAVLPEGLMGSNLATEICQMPTDKVEVKILEAVGSKLLAGPFCGKTKHHFPQS
ncbi:hypothetical protein ACFS7Z_20830 [Pontibacter toksunensis]|uniref:Uncharacterized protein n=1 Tax=Pontibacter toksunensis TaxID=1332631 RepID=A0ABW6C037_9BACT